MKPREKGRHPSTRGKQQPGCTLAKLAGRSIDIYKGMKVDDVQNICDYVIMLLRV